MAALFGGDASGGSGLSGFDLNAIAQAISQNIGMIHNRYLQEGIGVPSGDPAQAAASGQNLQYAGPSTMEQQDVSGQQFAGQAALGQLQLANAQNPAIPGSFGNLTQLAQQAGQGGFGQGFNANIGGQTGGQTGSQIG